MTDKQKKIAALDYSSVISEVFSVYFKRFAILVATAILVYGIPMVIFYLFTGSTIIDTDNTLGSAVGTILQLLLVGFIVLIVKEYLADKEVSALDNLKLIAPRLLSLFLSTIVKSIIIFIGLILFIFPGIYLAIRLSLSESAIINEGLGPIEGLNRSFEMNKSINWHIFSIAVIFIILLFFALLALIVVAAIVLGVADAVFSGNAALEFIGTIVGTIILAGAYVFSVIWQPVVYFRLLAVEEDGGEQDGGEQDGGEQDGGEQDIVQSDSITE
jgi:hypothetical protein